MGYFKKLSIRKKLTGSLLLFSIVPLMIVFVLITINRISTQNKVLTANGVTIARFTGNNCLAVLTGGDVKEATKTLSNLRTIPDVECAFLYDSKGQLVSGYERFSCFAPAYESPSIHFQNESLHVYQNIENESGKQGAIYVRFSTASHKKSIRNDLLLIVSVIAGVTILSLVFAIQLGNLISRPVSNLTEVAQKITEERDYSIRVKSETMDELGILSRRFNSMLNQIEKRKSERDQAEQLLSESEDRYRALVESSPEGIFLEQEESLIYANPAGLALSGFSSLPELQAVRLFYFLDPELYTKVREHLGESSVPVEGVWTRKDGSQMEVEITAANTLHRGTEAIQYLIRDITETNNLRRASRRMERLAALGEFSAMLAHEIRNSIGSVALNMRILSERMNIPEEFKKQFLNMERGFERVQGIIKSILEFARPASPRFQSVSINLVLESSIHVIESQLEQNGISLSRRYYAPEPQVNIDPNQISQVLVNLFLNAIQAMDPGGSLVVSTAREQDGVLVKVEDNGRGIPRENLDKIFDPFFTTNPSGTGLGLAFVSRILDQNKSQILVDSKLGQGTVFTIRFPL